MYICDTVIATQSTPIEKLAEFAFTLMQEMCVWAIKSATTLGS